MKQIGKYWKFVPLGANAGAALAVWLICILIFAGIVSRWVGLRLPSYDEISAVILFVLATLGLGYCLREGHHLRADFLFVRFPLTVRRILNRLYAVLFMLFAFAITSGLFLVTLNYFKTHTVSRGEVRIYFAIPCAFATVGALIFLVETALQVYRVFKLNEDLR